MPRKHKPILTPLAIAIVAGLITYGVHWHAPDAVKQGVACGIGNFVVWFLVGICFPNDLP
jgi:hypothetical protein